MIYFCLTFLLLKYSRQANDLPNNRENGSHRLWQFAIREMFLLTCCALENIEHKRKFK